MNEELHNFEINF